MSEYNLGTASGKIEIDGRGGALGFEVAKTAGSTFFDVIDSRIKGIQTLGRRMVGVGVAGVGGFGVAINAAATFEKSMSAVDAVTTGSRAEFELLRRKAMQLGADTSFSATEAAGALEELAKAGIPVKDILSGAADAAVALAEAGGIGIAEAAEISANAMNMFSLDAKEMSGVTDVLAGVANTSAADVSGIGQAMSQAGAVANLAGLSFRDTAIAIGEMADSGIKGSDAGTSLKTMLNNLIPTTKKQIDKFAELGLLSVDTEKSMALLKKNGVTPVNDSFDAQVTAAEKVMVASGRYEKGTFRTTQAAHAFLQQGKALNNNFFDQQGNVKKLGGLQGELGDALKGMTKEQKLSTLETLFGADAMRATAILSLAGADGYKKFSAEVSKTKASDVAKERMNNLSGAVEQFKGSLETVLIVIGSVFLPALTKVIKAATWLVNKFMDLPGPIQKAIIILGAIASVLSIVFGLMLAMLPMILAFIAHFLMMKVVFIVINMFKTFYATLRAGQGVMLATQISAARTGTAMSLLGKRMLFVSKMALWTTKAMRAFWIAMTGPIGLIIVGIIALAALGVLLYKKWKPFRDLVDGIVAVLRAKFQQVMKALMPILIMVNAKLKQFGAFLRDTVLPAVVTFGRQVGGKILAALIKFGKFVAATMIPVLRDIGDMLMGKVRKGFNETKKAVSSIQGPASALAKNFSANVLPTLIKIGNFLAMVGGKFINLATAIGKWLLPKLILMGNIFVTKVLPILAIVAGFFAGVLIDAIVGFVKGVVQVIKGVIQIFSGLIDFFRGMFTGNWSLMWSGLLKVMKGILNIIVGAFKIWWNIGMMKIAAIGFALLKGIFKGGFRLILKIFKGAGKGILGIMRGTFKLLWRVITWPFRAITRFIKTAWTKLRIIFFTSAQGMILTARILGRRVLGFFMTMRTRVVDAVMRLGTRIRTFFSNALTSIVTTVRFYLARVADFFANLPGRIMGKLRNFGSLLRSKGKELIQGLISGVTDKFDDLKKTMGKVGEVIGDFFPGSPIKQGPLRSWNNGGAGKRLIGVLAEGLEDTRPVRKSTRAVAGYINGVQGMVKPLALGATTNTGRLDARANRYVATGPAARVRPTAAKGGGRVINQTNNITNPRPEKASQSVSKVLRTKIEEKGWTS